MQPDPTLELSVDAGLSEVPAPDWDALVPPDDPFSEHAFLLALEESGSVGEGTGWLPRHLLLHRGGRLVGAAPCYLKTHSYGEYIFDWAWAEAAGRAGLPYYPKLVCAVPFTPVSGGRLLVHPEEDAQELRAALARGLTRLAEGEGASSVHVLFCEEAERAALAKRGYLPRTSLQYHWQNEGGWQCFEDFLGSLRSSARKQIRRERRKAQEHGLTISLRPAAALGAREWEVLWRCYQDTGARKWGSPYLTRAFFDRLPGLPEGRVKVALAHAGDEPVAAALLFEKGRTLYGRYWGSLHHYDHLHFELCYYTPLEHCLTHGLSRFEAGAQGEHKIRRGLMPRETRSAHLLRHPALHEAVGRFVQEEAAALREESEWLSRHGPFHRA
ncbi:MAG: GNAT family N-acetyltransferase [Deltaproteobacteria bacterium]|nr:GNAT family N-acetyltransferase [Deltaproteobacteria bacterium]